jgi:hypothetical protein
MTDKIDISVDAVADILEGVTPGPWHFSPECLVGTYVEGRREFTLVATVGPYRLADPVDERERNARFIAWAREAVPALSARLAEVEAERDIVFADWQKTIRCAAAAEAKLAATPSPEALIRAALRNIRNLNMTAVDENGHRWANSDLIEQEVMSALALLDSPQGFATSDAEGQWIRDTQAGVYDADMPAPAGVTVQEAAKSLGDLLFTADWQDGQAPSAAIPEAHDAAANASEIGRKHAMKVVHRFLRALSEGRT